MAAWNQGTKPPDSATTSRQLGQWIFDDNVMSKVAGDIMRLGARAYLASFVTIIHMNHRVTFIIFVVLARYYG